ncbi:NLR family carD domain protein 3 [Malassezia restricta]|uniref:NLR family carD domain protein 3 n=1 Tax=Malassezia restricta TaxID=76775 RepID=UPI000DD0F290|nr:NLR family carD domain protein 3 [Malassezia restricta]AXA52183.1 NLR family carD domain protein 3 [Malassezia restricta]
MATEADDDDETHGAVRPLPPSKARTQPGRSILRAAPPLANDTLWAGREWLYSVNARLAQKNVAVQVPVPDGHLLGHMLRRWHGQQPSTPPEHMHDAGLRHVHFRTEDLSHTYPISRTRAPAHEAETRERIESEALDRARRLCGRPWSACELESLYRVCCRAREDAPHASIIHVLAQAALWPQARARTLDFADTALAPHAVALADMLCAPTGVQVLRFDRCGLDTDAVRALAAAVFTSHSVHTLSLADNPGIQTRGWRAIGALVQDDRVLRHLDLSHHALSTSSWRAVLSPLTRGHSTLQTLRLDHSALRPAHLECVAEAVRASSLQHVSLRHSGLGDGSAPRLSRMLMDWDEHARPAIEDIERVGVVTVPATDDLYGDESQLHVITSLLHGHDAPHAPSRRHERREAIIARAQAFQHALSDIPARGHLLTLDLRGNALHDADAAILATALRRNRTLRVCSLADNHITPHGLACIADALRYNTTLETLDLSGNPCGGPALDGVLRLRVALAVHPRLKRVVFADTQLAAEGALVLAECLPDAEHLVHLDLTRNPLGLVGMLGLAAGTRRNASLRCLDVSLQDDPAFVEAARDVYTHCAHNTHTALAHAPPGVHVQRPLDKSALARALLDKEQRSTTETSQPASETEPSEYSEPADANEANDATPTTEPSPAAAPNERAASPQSEENIGLDAPDPPGEPARHAPPDAAHTDDPAP